MRSTRRHGLARALAPLMLLAGLMPLTSCRQRMAELTVPITGWPAYEYFYLAVKTGLDRQNGIAITPVQLPDPQAVINGFARGQFQVAQLSAAEVLDLCNRVPDRCPVVVLVLDASEGGDQLAVHKSVPSIAALKGGRVAVTFSTLGPYVLHLALQRHGLDVEDVSTQHIPLERMEQALAQGRVQAAATYPPFSEAITKAGHSRVLFTSRETPGEILDLLVVDQHLLQHQPLLIGKLIRVWERAHREARTTPKTSVAWMAGREGITPEDFRRSEAGLHYFSLQEQLSMLQADGAVQNNLQRVQEVLQALNISPPGAMLPKVTAEPVKAVLGEPARP